MNKNTYLIGLVILLLLIGGVVYVKNQKTTSTQSPAVVINQTTIVPSVSTTTQATEGATQKDVKEFTLTGSNFTFDPKELKVNKGDKVKITFKNQSGTHDFIIDEFNVGTKILRTGEEEGVEFVADKTGQFEYYCSVGNHRAMGMKGTLTVE